MYIAECPAIPGCVSQGLTEVEAERNINEAIKECLAVRAEPQPRSRCLKPFQELLNNLD